MRLLVLVLLLSVWVTAPADAHKPSDAYLALSVEGDHVTGQWDIALRDLDFAIGLDADGNGEITWGEVKAKHKEIAAYALARLRIAADGASCSTTVRKHLILLIQLMAIFALSWHIPAKAASHREAPLISMDPTADNTDVYAFVSYAPRLIAAGGARPHPHRDLQPRARGGSKAIRSRWGANFSNISGPGCGISGPASITSCFSAACCSR